MSIIFLVLFLFSVASFIIFWRINVPKDRTAYSGETLGYRLRWRFKKVVPHELDPQLLFWKAGDRLYCKTDSTWDRWAYRFKGFLESSLVIEKYKESFSFRGDDLAERELFEIQPWQFAHYRNEDAQVRAKHLTTNDLANRLKGCEYTKFVDEFREARLQLDSK